MSTRTARILAISLVFVYVIGEPVGLVFQSLTGRAQEGTPGVTGALAGGFIVLTWALAGALIAIRQPRNAIGWILLGIAVEWSISDLAWGYATYALSHPGSLAGGAVAAVIYNAVFFLAFGLLALLFLLFPDGSPPTRRWRPVGWLAAVTSVSLFAGTMLSTDPIDNFPGVTNPFGLIPSTNDSGAVGLVLFLAAFGALVASVVALLVRLHRSRGDERLQLKWFAYASSFLPLSFSFFFFFGNSAFTAVVGGVLLAVALIGIPIAAGLAILRYRLYDIDLVIRKTVVVAVLAAFTTIVYLAIVVGIGALVGSSGDRHNVLLAVAATAIVAIAFQPIRARARRLADRVVYGDRATPYDVLSAFSERLAGTFEVEDLPPRMARMLADGTGALRSDVWLRIGERLRPAGTWPADSDELPPVPLSNGSLDAIAGTDLAAPVRHRGELLGAVSITKRPGEPVTPMEERLVADLAAQAGLVLSNVRLIQELRASRQRLVSAQDEERRKLERNLHDGAQQQLVALAVKERLAEQLVERDPERARAMLSEIRAETTDALDTLRDLARGIYPPVLADRGLAAALEAQGGRAPIPVRVRADGLERYPQEVEAAAYFCCLEALQNVAKYARATEAVVRLGAEDGSLIFTVEDDGEGFDMTSTSTGTGIQGMTDRLEVLGGELEVTSRPHDGTTVTGRIPVASSR